MANDEYLEFENLDIYGFTMHSYPNIDGVVGFEISSSAFVFLRLVPGTHTIVKRYVMISLDPEDYENFVSRNT